MRQQRKQRNKLHLFVHLLLFTLRCAVIDGWNESFDRRRRRKMILVGAGRQGGLRLMIASTNNNNNNIRIRGGMITTTTTTTTMMTSNNQSELSSFSDQQQSTRTGIATTSTSSSSPPAPSPLSYYDGLVASRVGLDPSSNRFHAPFVYHENYSFHDWPKGYTFPMDKFARLAHALTTTCKKTHPDSSKLPRPLVRNMRNFFRPLDYHDIINTNRKDDWFSIIDQDYLSRFLDAELSVEECRRIGFREQMHRPELIERTVLEVAGTVLASQLACRYGISANVAGGTHHASPNCGAGYTILNDLAITAHVLTSNLIPLPTGIQIERVLVIDTDVHQGDGTAKFGYDILKGKLFTLSMHCESNYPYPKATSTYDIALKDGIRDHEYMDALQESVTKAISAVQPDFVLYDGGVDVYKHDTLGRFNLSLEGIRQRDRWVLEKCVSAGIPVAAVIGGGYDKDIKALARRHAIVHEECSYVWRKFSMWEKANRNKLY